VDIQLHQQPGCAANTPALSAVVDPDHDLIEITDGVGPLLSMSFDQASDLAEQIQSILVLWRRRRTPSRCGYCGETRAPGGLLLTHVPGCARSLAEQVTP